MLMQRRQICAVLKQKMKGGLCSQHCRQSCSLTLTPIQQHMALTWNTPSFAAPLEKLN